MTFEGEPPVLACGQSASVKLSGRFPKGTQLVVSNDDVVLDNLKVTATQATATVKVSPVALPGPVYLQTLTPVSGATRDLRLLEIRERLDLVLRFDDGWSVHVTPAGEAVWSKGGKTRESHAMVAVEEDGLRVRFEPSEEAQKLVQEQAEAIANLAAGPDAAEGASARFDACQKLPTDKLGPCLSKVMNEVAAVNARKVKEMDQVAARFEAKKPREAWGCDEVALRGTLARFTATATCAKPLQVTAQAKCLGPLPKEE